MKSTKLDKKSGESIHARMQDCFKAPHSTEEALKKTVHQPKPRIRRKIQNKISTTTNIKV